MFRLIRWMDSECPIHPDQANTQDQPDKSCQRMCQAIAVKERIRKCHRVSVLLLASLGKKITKDIADKVRYYKYLHMYNIILQVTPYVEPEDIMSVINNFC